MSKNPLRKDKTCLNCRYVVENRFCSNCGQENIDPRKTFIHLFIHFFEDLTHYENAFWKTIKNLIVKPSALTKEYLSGKRLSYLAPVRLYIFISFITFFLISFFPNHNSDFLNIDSENPIGKTVTEKDIKANEIIPNSFLSKAELDTIQKTINQTKGINIKKDNSFNFGIKSLKELDSIQKYGKTEDKYSNFEYSIIKKVLSISENNTPKEIIEKFKESFLHDIPKILIIYMPIFAFFLWLFHGKKQWYYFDHGIFTLHYFSFLLLLILILFLTDKIFLLFGDSNTLSFINGLIYFTGITWMIYYFFPAHHRFYGESRLISFIKTIFLFFINFFVIIILLLLFAFYTFINLH
ncbi:DUF3667 domain-containing protein [Flavobacterium sp. K5-23]|uniref:DUF3667 domain-containing protein n=1 Tax=Flavobacterium sp. K5-23 TaxID=2746225 RepID=UPI00200DA89B|nr:DUF3667 domain-containing protein [Flavobacterium sp. K5-23]UQD56660.1 DUF3667 domain-containing protein [Flavobacterium sp. K5-23]